MRIVLDTNILISALITNGTPRAVLNAIMTENHEIVIFRKIIEEFVKITAEPRIRKYVTKEEVTQFLQDLVPASKLIAVRSRLGVVRDHKDNPILATVYDGHASYLATGDEDLLALKKFRKIKIVTANDMLKILEA
ncbi:MAG: putative toxin-antitoxin system toxin component, PIN family [Thaumarchaeota archaeon]|nr:putative toxin-antitoxin system toxin component, PIN family [Nitrososphaerota archaeon]MDE1831920.1 putative toxin-antitoxin system toxin component, PIN family [Nitrososphaerota archaeon]MDE1840960.1 putative toxin-antitoxin system toxin component, PIN family [Nitrososphaerota archaeon]